MADQITIPKGWKMTTLGEAIDLIIDHRGLTPKKLGGDWSSTGYRAISAKSIKDGQLVNEGQMNLLSDDLYKRWMKDEVELGDIFLTSEAPLGEHIVWKSKEKLVLSQRIFGIRVNKLELDPFYFNYFIDSVFYQHELKSRESGSTVTGIKQSELLQTRIITPLLTEQCAIAAVLSSLDDKIELLREQNKTLEATAQAIFKEWFVNFNFPNVEGKPYKSSGGKMIDSELGKIPEGPACASHLSAVPTAQVDADRWRVGRIEDLTIQMNSGGTPSTKEESYYNGTINWFSTKELQDDFIFDSDKKITDLGLKNSSAKLFPKNTVVMAIYAAPTVGRLGILAKESAFNQAAVGLVAKNEISYSFVFLLLKHFRDELNGLANGAAQQNLNVGIVKNYKIIIPNQEFLREFNRVVEPLFEKTFNNTFQIQTLSTLRDTLLPKLIKGEVRVKGFKD